MSSNTTEIRKQTEEKVLHYFEQVGEYKVNLSATETDYDLTYIADKLAVCSNQMEKMSGIQYELVRVALFVAQATTEARGHLRDKEREYKGQAEYAKMPRDRKSAWLHQKLSDVRQEVEDWISLDKTVSEVRGAVVEKIGMHKRLESTIRLQQKVYEVKVSSGATSPRTFRDTHVGELDLT